jgi:DNA modification methylase
MDNGFNIASRFKPTAQAVVFEGDCREMLRQVPTGTIQLVVTSPPYNLGKEYEKRLHLDDYVAQQREVIAECVRVLSGRGSICWQVGNYVEDAPPGWLDAAFCLPPNCVVETEARTRGNTRAEPCQNPLSKSS